MEDETNPNEDQNTPETEVPAEKTTPTEEVETVSPEVAEEVAAAQEAAPAENPTPAEPEAPVEPEAPAEESAPAEETPSPEPAPESTPPQATVEPTSSVQNAVDVMKEAAKSKDIGQQLTEDAKKQKEFFEKQPKVMMNIPLKEGEKSDSYETVQVNGYRLQIRKGVVVSLPQGVAEILANFYNIQLGTGAIPEEAGIRADRNEQTANALAG